MALQGVIKSMPSYAQHHRAGVCWPREGREFIVVADEKQFEGPGKEARALYDELLKAQPDGIGVINPDQPVVYHVADPTPQNPKRSAMKRGRIVDIPGKPVVMDLVAYEYIKESFGSYLSCEPIGGMQDVMAQQQKIEALEQENARLRASAKK